MRDLHRSLFRAGQNNWPARVEFDMQMIDLRTNKVLRIKKTLLLALFFFFYCV